MTAGQGAKAVILCIGSPKSSIIAVGVRGRFFSTMISEPDRDVPGRSTRPWSGTGGRDRDGGEGRLRRNGHSLWSTVRRGLFDASEWQLRLAHFHGRAG